LARLSRVPGKPKRLDGVYVGPGIQKMVERLILALRTDFGCLVIIVAFLVIMISTIVFANILTPPSSNPLL
jgi:hypothetical protein